MDTSTAANSMSVVAIVGAGALGGALAQTIAARDRVRSVRLVDEAADVAAGKALDIRQSAPVDGFTTRVTAHGDLAAAADADIVVLAGPAADPDAEWSAAAALEILDRLAGARPSASPRPGAWPAPRGAVTGQQRPHRVAASPRPGAWPAPRGPLVVCAGASHRRLVERAVTERGASRRRLFGSAPEALRAAVTAVVALDIGCPATEVSLTPLGIPPRHVVVPWRQATVAGQPLEQRISAARLARAQARTQLLWPPGPYALAAAAARIVAALVDRIPRLPTCFAVPDGALGLRDRALAVPVQLDATGIARIAEPPLTADERAQMHAALRAAPGGPA